ncbi:MAG: radical SAM protein, partial [Tannerella sp.]|nr:radical SAM protein [Tannerella sp.]
MKCNYRCRYCLVEAMKKECASAPEVLSPAVLTREVLRFAGDREIGSVQFWGGEPLLHENFERIKALHRALVSAGQMSTDFFLSTNGSLLYGDRLDWLLENNIAVAVSWDGPGQHLRGPDIFQDDRVMHSVRTLMRSTPDRLTFNPVMTSENRSYGDYVKLLENTLGQKDFRLSEAKLSTIGDDAAWDCRVPEDALPAYSSDYYQFLLQDKGTRLGV